MSANVVIVARDPRSDSAEGSSSPLAAGHQSPGGQIVLQAVDLGNGCAALVTIAATRTPSSVGPDATSTQLLAADSTRIAVTIANTDGTYPLYLGFNGAAAVLGSGVSVPPGAAYNVPAKYVAGKITGIWNASATGGASITATTA